MKTYLKDLTLEEVIKRLKNGEVFSSIQEASNKYNVCHEAIRQAVHNKTKSCGLHFIFN